MPGERQNQRDARILICEDEVVVAGDIDATLRDLGREVAGESPGLEDSKDWGLR